MRFAFVGSCTTDDVSAHYACVQRVSDYLDIELSVREYGSGVTKVLMGVNCCGRVLGAEHLWRDFETGVVVHKKYTKSGRLLEVEFKLSHREVTSCDPDSDRFVEILERGALATYGEVKALRIKDFDIDAFYKDIGDLFVKRGWIKNPDRYKFMPYERSPFAFKGPSHVGIEQRFPLPEEIGALDFRLYTSTFIDSELKPGLQAQMGRISDDLAKELSKNAYGPGLATVAIYVWCYTPADVVYQIHDPREFNNRGWREYVKPRRILVWNVQLDCGEILSSDEKDLVNIVKRGILATYGEIKALGIQDFDIAAMYRDIRTMFERQGLVSEASLELGSRQDSPFRFEMHPFLYDPAVKRGLLDQVGQMSEYLASQLSNRDYGPGATRITLAVWCNTSHRDLQPYFGTGWKRYFESTRTLLCDVKLDHAQIKSSPRKRLVGILTQSVLDTRSGVEALGIKDFAIDAFYRDIQKLLTDKDWLGSLEKAKAVHRKTGVGIQEGLPNIPDEMKMPETDFWELIGASIKAGDGIVGAQIAYIEDHLAARGERDIVGFELTLRDLIRKSYHYNVVALLKAIDGQVTDDSLLYFRCRLILYGWGVFRNAVENPNKLTERLDSGMGEGEDLMYVSDSAFMRKFGEDTDKELPRSIGSTYSDYDFGGYPVLGRPWTDRTFEKRYAPLLKLYE